MLTLGSRAQALEIPQQDVSTQAREAASKAGDAVKDAARTAEKEIRNDPWAWGHIIAAGIVLALAWGRDWIRPGSLARAGRRQIDAHPWWVWGACAGLVVLAQVAGTALAAMIPALASEVKSGSTRGQAVVAACTFGAAGLTAVTLARLIHGSAPGAGLTLTRKDLPRAVLFALAVWPVVTAVGLGATALSRALGEPAKPIAHPTLASLVEHPRDPWAWATILLAVTLVPCLEEILYRGFLQSLVLRISGRPWLSVLISSAVFTVMHVQPDGSIPWPALCVIGALGISLGIVFERTKSLTGPVVVHAAFNTANVVLALFHGSS